MHHAGTVEADGKVYVSVNIEAEEIDVFIDAFQELAIRLQCFSTRDYNNINATAKRRLFTGKALQFFSKV